LQVENSAGLRLFKKSNYEIDSFIEVLKKLRIVTLNQLNHIQFFIYLHYKAYLLYGVQWLYEKWRKKREVPA
ncbi:hypothetical protein P9G46_15230, partial [Weizmannia sp. CD-2023]|nr:hypothetical protein [Weizmannia sp. CD-2023]MEC2342252.1 hypothetical protein [Weizmannia sp. CD-2023]